jgi:uncharacterized protein (DUF362 family)
MKRCEFLKAAAGGLVGLAGASPAFLRGFLTPSLPDAVWVENGEPAELVRTALETLGGIDRFVSRGDVVVLKPNMGFDRPPQAAATTNPDLVAEVVRQCFHAGAKQVKVFDRTCNNPLRCYQNSQIEAKAKAAGAKVAQVRGQRFVNKAIRHGVSLNEWPIYRDYLEADKVINIPVAKHHNLCGVTLGLKNLMGAMGGERGTIHSGFSQKLIDITAEILPTITIIDAYRVLTANGPSGGNLNDVRKLRTLILSPCTVTADYLGTQLFNILPTSLGYLREALRRDLNRYDLNALNLKKISLS